MLPRLVTIGPSPYVEKARWALQRHGINFVEEPHVPMFHWRATRPYGRRTAPLLVLPDGTSVGESTDIVAWADASRPDRTPLLGPGDREVIAHLDDKVGKHARRVAYGSLLASRGLTVALFAGSPSWELTALSLGFPLWRQAIVRGLDVTPSRVAASRERLRQVFDALSDELADGRPWLGGDRFGARDLALASLAGSVLLPREHGWAMPDDDALRAALRDAVTLLSFRAQLLDTPAGVLCARAYAEQRHLTA